jgi:uncharacterized protein (DUF4415 family)
MKSKWLRPSAEENREIARAIANDPDAAPDLSQNHAGVVRKGGRPSKPDAKVSVTLRLDRDIVERFKASGAGWQTRINAALRQAGGK